MKLIPIVLLICSLLLGCAKNQSMQNNSSKSITVQTIEDGFNSTMIDNKNFISYCAKEKSKENQIYFNYPLFNEIVNNADQLNAIIINFVDSTLQDICNGGFVGNLKDFPENWDWSSEKYTVQAMYINYKIERSDSDYLSVIFEGLCNYKGTPHPLKYFNSLIIDIENCELVTLVYFYNINEAFIELIRKEFPRQFISYWGVKEEEYIEEYLTRYTDDELIEKLKFSNLTPSSGIYSYLTFDQLGISFNMPYAIGGHFEVLIDYEELTEYLKLP